MRNIIKKINTYFKQLDIFGVNLNFKYNKKDTYQSACGSFLTILITVYLSFKLVTSVRDIILKENLEVKIEEFPEKWTNIDLKDFFVGVCNVGAWERADSEFLDKHSHMYYNNFLEYEYNPPVTESKSLSADNCETVRWMDPFRTCKCIRFTQEKYTNISKSMDYFLYSANLGIGINLDLNNFEYKDDPEQLDRHKLFIIVTNANYINTSDYYNHTRSYYNFNIDKVEQYTDYQVNYFYDKIQIDKVNDIYSFGLFDPYTETNYTYSVSKVTTKSMENNQRSDLDYGLYVNFKSTGMVQKYIITTFSLESFLAKFGGYLEVIFLVFNLISQTVNSFLLERQIKRSFIKKIKKIQKLKDCNLEEVNQGNKMDYSERHQMVELENVNQNCVVVEENNNDHHNNDAHQVVNNENIKIEVNNYINRNFSPLQKQKTVILELNLQKISDEDKHLKLIVEDFQNIFDFKKLYYLIKEIKLMKYFLFTKEQKFYIKHFKKIPFQVDKLEKFEKIENKIDNPQNVNPCGELVFENKLIELREFFNNIISDKQ